ncbi:hypothetical protein DCAR_0209072 [Daucus carota subsp. sativus]|uniref:LisH domain-containing protein n=1 Tax=Daucus carota subsp. sativus TaxID=79200 RepID=A0A166F0D3_DAUCS|nr:hypothetical protein DCAR_0209072 [Daucus carota subsp. sativus]
MAFKNEGDVEKMLDLYIYNHMKEINLQDVAEIFAKEANIETSQLVEIEVNLMRRGWLLFWLTLCSRLLNKAGVNAQSSGQQMAFGKEWDKERELAMKNEGDAQKMLELYIYDHMKKKNLLDVASRFAKEANVETSQLGETDENLLLEWWEFFCPAFCSGARVNAQSSGQAMASWENQGAGSTRQTSMVNLQPDMLAEFSTTGGEDNGSSQMPSRGRVDSDGLNHVLSRTHAPAIYLLLMALYVVRTEP